MPADSSKQKGSLKLVSKIRLILKSAHLPTHVIDAIPLVQQRGLGNEEDIWLGLSVLSLPGALPRPGPAGEEVTGGLCRLVRVFGGQPAV